MAAAESKSSDVMEDLGLDIDSFSLSNSNTMAIKPPFHCKICKQKILSKNEIQEHMFSKEHVKAELDLLTKAENQEMKQASLEREKVLNSTPKKPEVPGSNAAKSTSAKKKYTSLEREKVLNTAPKKLNNLDDNPVLNQTLIKISNDYGLSVKDLKLRRSVFHYVKNSLILSGSNCNVSLFGSSLTGAGLAASNIDICIENAKPHVMIEALHRIQENDAFGEIKESLHKLPPRFSFKHQKSGLTCTISCETEHAVETSRLIQIYMSMDKRVMILAQCFRFWAKVCEIDRKSDGTLTPYCYTLMLIHFLQTRKVLPVLGKNANIKWNPKNDETLSQLWLGLLRYYVSVLKMEDFVVNIEMLSRATKTSKKWYGHVFAIADPNIGWKNVAHSLSKKVIEYFKSCFATSLHYFGKQQKIFSERKPRCCTMTTSESEIEPESMESTVDDYESDDENEDDGDFDVEFLPNDAELDSLFSLDENALTKSESESSDSDVVIEDDGTCLIDLHSPDEPNPKAVSQGYENNSQLLIESLEDMNLIHFGESACTVTSMQQPSDQSNHELLVQDDKLYSFTRKNLCKITKVPIFCGNCKILGHRKDKCPKDRFYIEPLTSIPQNTIQVLPNVFDMVLASHEPTDEDLRTRLNLVNKLQQYIKREYPDAKLSLFGSSNNGLGFRNSDMDISMVLQGRSAEDIEQKMLITKLGKLLRKCDFVNNISVITSAKVPIIKFNFKASQDSRPIEADISLYNLLALENTKLLLTYCRIDERVRKLGYALKFFAKKCEICDASRGTLSSYAHIIMLIHFLQQRNPPVLPVLQELWTSKDEKPVSVVEGWDSWFYSDYRDMANVWPHFGKNTETVGQLWLDFFRYYVEEFDFKTHVVSIRQSKPLRKFEKSWNRFDMSIEDPFKLEHNLAAGITTKVFRYIFNIFVNGRKLYSTEWKKDLPELMHMDQLVSYFFNAEALTKDLRMPQDRLCRRCGKIGHTRKHCTAKQTANQRDGNAKSKSKKSRDTMQKDRAEKDRREESAATQVLGNRVVEMIDNSANSELVLRRTPHAVKEASGVIKKPAKNLREIPCAARETPHVMHESPHFERVGPRPLQQADNSNEGTKAKKSKGKNTKDKGFQKREESDGSQDGLSSFKKVDGGKRIADTKFLNDLGNEDNSADAQVRSRSESTRHQEMTNSMQLQNVQQGRKNREQQSANTDKDDIIAKLAQLMEQAEKIKDNNQIEQMKKEVSLLENKFCLSTIEKKITRDVGCDRPQPSSEPNVFDSRLDLYPNSKSSIQSSEPKPKPKLSRSLFGSDEDDIFRSKSTPQTSGPKPVGSDSKLPRSQPKLFGSDEDDLFRSKSTPQTSGPKPVGSDSKLPRFQPKLFGSDEDDTFRSKSTPQTSGPKLVGSDSKLPRSQPKLFGSDEDDLFRSKSTPQTSVPKPVGYEPRHLSADPRSCDISVRRRESAPIPKEGGVEDSEVGKAGKKKKKKKKKPPNDEQPIQVGVEKQSNQGIQMDVDMKEVEILQNGEEAENTTGNKKNPRKRQYKKQHRNINSNDARAQGNDAGNFSFEEAPDHTTKPRAAAADNTPKVVKTNMSRMKSNNEFLSLLNVNPVLDFNKSKKKSKDDSELRRNRQEGNDGSRPRENAGRGTPKGSTPSRFGSQRGRGNSRGGHKGADLHKQEEDSLDNQSGHFRGRGQERGGGRGRGRGRGNQRGQYRGRGQRGRSSSFSKDD